MANTTVKVGTQALQMLFTEAGLQVVDIPLNKRASVLVKNPSGASTFDVVGFTMSEEEAAAASPAITRTQFPILEAITDVFTSKASIGGLRQIGVDVTAFVGPGPVTVEMVFAGESNV